ncbi:MAG: 30S ribosomal protein S8 [Candidatus Vogelbacteria bacterium RIFOXYD1_FULL_44_32]|uniref:Small ribosomal subunit protein uS8 n=1 Tax=Candidatus Vogelbacteria bacterium RIFOXYD1_FULL_44_32 TaxID=1802438 RepID=A0A1G2QFP7_9BACT|nr:MAG: 30S ribosomal protein S8 [Candidatus Vogelbacteria bacterium RIFOXYD1_FULL_44_32]
MVTDPISDMLNRVLNAGKINKPQVCVDYSNAKLAVATVLKQEGYLAGVAKRAKRNHNYLYLDIAYAEDGQPALTKVQRISKPSRRVYEKATAIKSVRQGLGIAVISTPKGVMTDRQARKEKVGGEVMLRIW